MQVLDYRHSDPTPSPPHNASWLLDNQPTTSPVPHPSSSPPHHFPLAPSNSLTGISSHQPPPSSTPLQTSSSSTLHPSSHPSRATSDLYPSQYPSAPRDSPLTHHSRLNTLSPQHNLNLNNSPANNNTNNNRLAKFGNLLNVSNVAIEHGRENNHIALSRSASNHPEIYKDIPPHSYPNPTSSFSAPLEYRHITHAYHEPNQFKQPDTASHERTDPYQPMHRPHFPSYTYPQPASAPRPEHFNAQHATLYHQDYPGHALHTYDNTVSPPYPGTAPMPMYKERRYGIPKCAVFSPQGDGMGHTGASTALKFPSFKPMGSGIGPVSNGIRSRSQSPVPAKAVQNLKGVEVQDSLGGALLRETIEAFRAKGMNPERADFLRDYTELMKAYEEKCDVVYDSTERTCMELMLKSRVPLLEDTMTAPVDDETPEDACQKLVVKKKFVEAMEALQGDQLPTKRRGNLPKECTDYFRKWFNEHHDHPYPTDEEKLEMSKRTKIGMSQISHWFINHRKRVWKPSLPADHPALNGDLIKKPRKKRKTCDDEDQLVEQVAT